MSAELLGLGLPTQSHPRGEIRSVHVCSEGEKTSEGGREGGGRRQGGRQEGGWKGERGRQREGTIDWGERDGEREQTFS